jgi:hypothetical protein
MTKINEKPGCDWGKEKMRVDPVTIYSIRAPISKRSLFRSYWI